MKFVLILSCSNVRIQNVIRGGPDPILYWYWVHYRRHSLNQAPAGQDNSQTDTTGQKTLADAFREKVLVDNPKAKGITETILNSIILDDQPLSVMENVRLCSLLEHLETRYHSPLVARHFLASWRFLSVCQSPEVTSQISMHIDSTAITALCIFSSVWKISQWILMKYFFFFFFYIPATLFRNGHLVWFGAPILKLHSAETSDGGWSGWDRDTIYAVTGHWNNNSCYFRG